MDPHLGPLIYRLKRDLRELSPLAKRAFFSMLVLLIPILGYQQGVGTRIEPKLLKVLYWKRGEREIPSSVSIVRLDKPAYDLVGRSTGELFPRDKLAAAVREITRLGAKLVIIDGIPSAATEEAADQAFAAMLRDEPVVIGRYKEQLTDVDPRGEKTVRSVPLEPIALFASVAKAIISLGLNPFPDGVVRMIVLTDKTTPQLEVLKKFLEPKLEPPGDFDFINYYGPASSITSISVADIIAPNAEPDPAYFKDRVVWLGMISEAGAGIAAGKDTFLTPASDRLMYGVEIHATITANLLDRSFIRRFPVAAEVFGLSLASFALAYLVFSLSAPRGTFAALAAAAVWGTLSFQAFSKFHTFVPALTFIAMVIPAIIALRWGIEVFSKFKEYVPAVLENELGTKARTKF